MFKSNKARQTIIIEIVGKMQRKKLADQDNSNNEPSKEEIYESAEQDDPFDFSCKVTKH